MNGIRLHPHKKHQQTRMDLDEAKRLQIQTEIDMMGKRGQIRVQMSETLHRQPKDIDMSELANNLQKCQWCNKALDPTDRAWHCVARLDHYLVCDECHDKAIVH